MLDMKRGLSSTLGLAAIAAIGMSGTGTGAEVMSRPHNLGPAYVPKTKRAGSKNNPAGSKLARFAAEGKIGVRS